MSEDRPLAYCPHCGTALDGDRLPWPLRQQPCPECRLTIGAGRARSTPRGDLAARSRLANALRRKSQESPDGVNPDDVIEAIRKTAQEAEVSIGSLSMETYRGATSCDERLPKIDSVIGAFGTWKKARSAAHKS